MPITSTKLCNICNKTKSSSEFSINIRRNTYRYGRCRECHNKNNRKRYSIDLVFRQKIRDDKKIRYLNNPNYTINNNLYYKFGITLEQYNKLLILQKYQCAICKVSSNRVRSGKSKRFAVDHCHITNKIRGLLCDACNLAIGNFKDNFDLCDKASEYLKRNQL